MARYDIYRVNNNRIHYVLDVQTNLLDDLDTVVVVPFVSKNKANSEVINRLKPIIKIEDSEYVLMTTDISAFHRKALKDIVCNIEENYALTIVDALDFLFQGF